MACLLRNAVLKVGAAAPSALWLPALLVLFAGCASTKYAEFREVPHNPLTAQLRLLDYAGPQPGPRTVQLLRRYDLADKLGQPSRLLEELHPWVQREPTAEHYYAVAEIAYLGGKKKEKSDPQQALDLYGAAAMHAYLYLFDPRLDGSRNPYDPQYRGACELYNTALEECLRLVHASGKLQPGKSQTVTTASRDIEISVQVRGRRWRPDEFERFEFVSDYEVSGLRNHYRGHGLGVPLIAIRHAEDSQGPLEDLYPPNLSVPVTAFLRMDDSFEIGSPGGGQRVRAVIELYDPLETRDIRVAGRWVPLESDTTTPLAYFLSQPEFADQDLSTLGLLYPEKASGHAGIYMLEPFRPDKIPVIMVHGLWSSPLTWMEMYNDLRNDPATGRDYQFWFYLYPTGQPFWLSAAQMRKDLDAMRRQVDPQHRLEALDHMVLVGHSMGGLVSKLQTVHSENDFWQTLSDKPFRELKADPETKAKLSSLVFFEPNPSVDRVITIGTPHRGSEFANDVTRWVGSKLIALPMQLVNNRATLMRENPGFFKESSMLSITTSIDSLAPESPFLPVLYTARPGQGVRYHTVIGKVARDSIWRRISGTSDGIVHVDSAKLEDAASELTVEAEHAEVHRHPRSILEVRRILLEHTVDLRNARPYPRQPAQAMPVSVPRHGRRPAAAAGGQPLFNAPPLQPTSHEHSVAAEPGPG